MGDFRAVVWAANGKPGARELYFSHGAQSVFLSVFEFAANFRHKQPATRCLASDRRKSIKISDKFYTLNPFVSLSDRKMFI